MGLDEDKKHASSAFIEQVVIGCCLTEKGLIKQMLASLNENDFYHTNTLKIFDVIKEQYIQKRECDIVLLKQHINEQEYKFAISCVSLVTNIGFFTDYISQLKENSIKRGFRQIGLEIQKLDDTEINNNIAKYRRRLSELSISSEEKKDRMEGMLDALKELERLRLRGGYEMRSRISGLDELLGGFCRKRVYVLGAKSSFGKTTFAVMCAHKIAAFDHVPTNFYSLEMSHADILYKTLTLVTKVPIWKMQKPKYLSKADQQSLFRGLDIIYKTPLDIKTEHKTLDQILTDIQRTRPGFAAIDYFQHLPAIPNRRNEKEIDIYRRYMEEISNCAKENNCSILILSQIKRGAQMDGVPPDQSDFQNSSAIEQTGDVCMILYWPIRCGGKKISKKKIDALPLNYQELHIVKNKFGVSGEIPLMFDGEFQQFIECNRAGTKFELPQGGDKNA